MYLHSQLQTQGLLIDIAEEQKLNWRKEKQSIVWAHFTRAEEDGDVTCLHCKKRLKYSTGSTTSMRNHLRARHPAEMYRSERHRVRQLLKHTILSLEAMHSLLLCLTLHLLIHIVPLHLLVIL